MDLTGTLADDTRTLTLVRQVDIPIEQAWAWLTSPDRLAMWYGRWSGYPSRGHVMVSMDTDTPDAMQLRHDILALEKPSLLSVRTGEDEQECLVTVRLRGRMNCTQIEFSQTNLDAEALPSLGPAWEWYLDRFVAACAGVSLPTMDEFESDYMSMATDYLELVH